MNTLKALEGRELSICSMVSHLLSWAAEYPWFLLCNWGLLAKHQ